MLVNTVVKHGNVIGVGETTVFGTPTRAVPGQAVPQQGFEDHSGHLSMGHQAIFVLMKIRFFVNLKIV